MPQEFWSMTFTEIEIACKGYETRMARVKEVPRLIAAILMNVNRRKNSAAIRLEDVWPLYTDQRRDIQLMTKEEYEQAKKMMGR
jgi:hypothetical protein